MSEIDTIINRIYRMKRNPIALSSLNAEFEEYNDYEVITEMRYEKRDISWDENWECGEEVGPAPGRRWLLRCTAPARCR